MNTNQKYLQSLLKLECPDSSYNPLRSDQSMPQVVITEAIGSKLKCADGKSYFDCISGFGSLILGHGHSSYKDALESHLKRNSPSQGLGDVYASEAKINLIEKLVQLTPKHLEKVALAVTGSQAVELALKTAYLKTKKSGVLSFSGAYHGLDLGVLGLEGRGSFQKPFAHAMQNKNIQQLPFGCELSEVRKAVKGLQQSHAGFAAIVVEPLQGRGGIVEPPAGWIKCLREVASEFEGLLVLDEIWTGMGRTGSWLYSGVEADLVCIGKALGGGMPISAVLGTSEAFGAWPENGGEALHTGTFFGHALACEVALSTLNEVESIFKNGSYVNFVEVMKNTLSRYQDFLVFGRGHLCGVRHPRLNPQTIMHNLVNQGVLALPAGPLGNVLSLTPPLTITQIEAEQLAEKIIRSVKL
jgi:4-aminobutyrate aminotransferase/(S)-3-amino-2-methylpropionate transaminase